MDVDVLEMRQEERDLTQDELQELQNLRPRIHQIFLKGGNHVEPNS